MSLVNKVQQFISDADTAHSIVHGDANTTVQTEGGPVRSFAKLMADTLSFFTRLGSPDGSSGIGYGESTVQIALDLRPTLEALSAEDGAKKIGHHSGSVASALDTLFRPDLANDGRAQLRAILGALNGAPGKKVTWIGDSITEQGKPTMGTGTGLGIGFTTYIEQAYPNITYSNQGIGGQTTLDIINRLASITATAADLYVLAIGVNDARYNDARGASSQAAYIANIRTIVNALKAAGGKVVVISIWPTFWADQYANLGRKKTDDRFKRWNAALDNVCAQELMVPYVDAYTPIVKAIDFYNVGVLNPDGVHPDYAGTLAKALYATAVLRGDVGKGQFYPLFSPTGTVGFKIRVLDNGQADKLASIKNIKVSPYHNEKFGFSANPAISIEGLFGSYNSGYAGYLNKIGDFPFEFIVTADQFPAAITTLSKGIGRGIRAYELYRSDDPLAFSDPSHPSWQLLRSEYSNLGIAFNLLPRKREMVFYRIQFEDSTGADGTGGATGTYVKVKQIWGGVEPVRFNYANLLNQGPSERVDLVFSAAGGSAAEYLANVANTYPLHIMWEAPQTLNTVQIASVGEAGRNIKNWKLFRSRDPLCINDAAHISWVQISSGVGDATIAIP